MESKHFKTICGTKDRTHWLKERSKYIGASDAAAILGCNPWSSALDVYASKLGMDEDTSASEPAYWGTRLEPVLLTEFERRTGRPTKSWGELVVSKERPWQACTMDGFQELHFDMYGGVECKCTRLQWSWKDGLPPYVMAQIQHQYAVTGLETISICVLFNGNEFYQKDVPRDEAYIENLNKEELEFWDRLKAFEPPDPDSSEASKRALAKLYPQDDGERIVLGPEFTALDSRLVALKDEHKDIGQAIRGEENKIKAEMGNATSAICTDGTIFTLKTQTRAVHEVAASTFRVLRRKGGKL